MNTLVRNSHDDESMNDDPFNFAPKRIRLPEHDHSPGGEAPRVNSLAPPDELKASELPWKQNKLPSAFAGGVAVAGVGVRRNLAPDPIPDLQSLVDTPSTRRARQFSSAIRALLVICVMGAPLAFIFVFASGQHQIDLASRWTAISISTAKIPPAESEGFAVRTGSDSEVQTQSMEMAAHSDTVPNADKTRALPSPPAIELTAIENSLASPEEIVMPDVSFAGKLQPLREAQTGVWTYCVVDLIPSGQIAVQKAMTYQACISAGKKCAGPRRYVDIQFFVQPTLTSKVPLELCFKET